MLGDIIVRYASLSSTNDEARARAASLPEGAVIAALAQTRGRGRLGRAWESKENAGLYFSVILKEYGLAFSHAGSAHIGSGSLTPTTPPGNAPSLALAAGMAARRAIEEVSGLEPLLKWPNDVLIGSKKICGILLETRAAAGWGGEGSAEPVPPLICGIGVNVNNEADGFSPDLAGKAASLFMEKGRKFSADEVMYAILRHFDAVYRVWLAEGFAALRDEYSAYCVHFRGSRAVTVQRGSGAFSGVAGENASLSGIAGGNASLSGIAMGNASLSGVAGENASLSGVVRGNASLSGIAGGNASLSGVVRENASHYGVIGENASLSGIVGRNASLTGIVKENAALSGIADGITAEGGLVILAANGQRVVVTSGEVTVCRSGHWTPDGKFVSDAAFGAAARRDVLRPSEDVLGEAPANGDASWPPEFKPGGDVIEALR